MPDSIQYQIIIPESHIGQRLDVALAALLPDYSRSRLQEWIKSGAILVNGKQAIGKQKVQGNEHIEINALLSPEIQWNAQDIPLDIIYEDDYLIVVNKPVGLVTHPAAGNPDQTLVNALLHHCPYANQLPRGGIIHRLDKDTSGLLLAAKTLEAHTHLVQAMQQRQIHRHYEAIVKGVIISGGTIEASIGRDLHDRKRMAVVSHGKFAKTHYTIVERFNQYTYVNVKLETGRTHQIRVHLTHIGYPLLGDQMYGAKKKMSEKNMSPQLITAIHAFNHQALHAAQLCFIHPITQEQLHLQAPLPAQFQQLLYLLRENK